jgi:hypothetical protein
VSALLKNSEYILFGIKTNYIGLSKIVIAAILALEKTPHLASYLS